MTTLLPSSADCLEILRASTSWSPKGLSRPLQDKSCKKSLLLSTVQYAPSNGGKHDISKAFLRIEMVKVVKCASPLMRKAEDTAKTIFPSLKSSGFGNYVQQYYKLFILFTNR